MHPALTPCHCLWQLWEVSPSPSFSHPLCAFLKMEVPWLKFLFDPSPHVYSLLSPENAWMLTHSFQNPANFPPTHSWSKLLQFWIWQVAWNGCMLDSPQHKSQGAKYVIIDILHLGEPSMLNEQKWIRVHLPFTFGIFGIWYQICLW